VISTDEIQGDVGAAFAKRLGAARPFVLRDSGIYGQLMAEEFTATATRIGLTVVGGPEEVRSTDDVPADVRKIQQSGADLVYWAGTNYDLSGKLWQEMRDVLGDGVILLGPDGIYTTAFVATAGPAAEGTYTTATAVPGAKLTGRGADWYQRYRQRFQSEPIGFAAYAYEAMNVALAAIERAATKDRAAIRDAIDTTRDYDGILGKWSFTPTGDTTLATMSVRQVRNGKWDNSTVQIIDASPP